MKKTLNNQYYADDYLQYMNKMQNRKLVQYFHFIATVFFNLKSTYLNKYLNFQLI